MARAGQALAFNGHHASDLASNALQSINAHFFLYLRANELNHPAKRVVPVNVVGQRQKRREPLLLCFAKLQHIHSVIGNVDGRAQRNHQQVHQFMAPCALDARIGYLPQVLHQACPRALSHQQLRLLKNHMTIVFILCA